MQTHHYNFSTLVDQFNNHGLIHLPQLVPPSICEQVVNTFHNGIQQENHLIKLDRVSYRKTGAIKHGVINGFTIEKYFLPINAIYFTLKPLVSVISGKEIICGKYPVSDINLVVYHKGSFKDPHFDTVPVTLVLFLTTHLDPPDEGVLHYQGLDTTNTTIHQIKPIAGDAVIFQGRKIKHWVKEMKSNDTRIVVNANYYYSDDQERETAIDDFLYQNK